MQSILQTESLFLGNPLRTWLLALATAVVVYIGLAVARRLVVRYLAALTKRTATYVDDIVRDVLTQTKVFFLLFVSAYAGVRVLATTPDVGAAIRYIGVIVIAMQAAIWGNTLITGFLQRETQRRLSADPDSAMTLNALAFIGRLVFWAIVLLMALDNLGVDVTALITGLGIGGIAVALAVQNVLGDLFASLSIVMDKPFVVGDFIIVDDKAGTVERVGLKTSRVRALSGEQLVFSNSDLLKARIQNFKRMFERRILFTLGVTYQTPRAQLAAIPGIIRRAIDEQEKARFDRAHFARYGDFAIIFEAVYFVTVPEYNVYMDVQQAVNLRIHEAFEEAGIEFAYPTQTLYLERTTGAAAT